MPLAPQNTLKLTLAQGLGLGRQVAREESGADRPALDLRGQQEGTAVQSGLLQEGKAGRPLAAIHGKQQEHKRQHARLFRTAAHTLWSKHMQCTGLDSHKRRRTLRTRTDFLSPPSMSTCKQNEANTRSVWDSPSPLSKAAPGVHSPATPTLQSSCNLHQQVLRAEL